MRNILLLGILFFVSLESHSQVDLTSWSALQFNYVANDKLTISLKPIQRQNQNLSAHNNLSIDVFMNYKLGKGWSASLLERHFFIPDNADVEFFFFDLKNSQKVGSKFQISNGLRYHLNISGGRNFIRYIPFVSMMTGGKFTPFAGLDFFMDAELENLAGARYTAGVKYKVNAVSGLNFTYWRQAGYSDAPIGNHHNLYLTYSYTFRPAPPE